MDKRIKTIEFIRDLQVKKKRRHLISIVREMKKAEVEIGEIHAEIKESTEAFESKKMEVLGRLHGKRTSVDALYLIRRRELANHNLVREKNDVMDDLSHQLIEKRVVKREKEKELWNSEKGLIKIQEFIKFEVDNE